MKRWNIVWTLTILTLLAFPAASTAVETEPTTVEAAVRHYRQTGDAPAIDRGDVRVYPYGESEPVVVCSPLRACDVELQAGEQVTGVAVGDTERWITSPLESGDPRRPIPHVIVKPTAYDLATNLVIGTTRRTYHLRLLAPAEPAGSGHHRAYHRHVSFYYPAQMVERWTTRERLREEERRIEREATVTDLAAPRLTSLNFDYKVRRGWFRRARFAPSTVFDDGERTYLRLPESARTGDLPALLVERAGGELGIVNYRVQDGWYVVDGTFERAKLVVGVGKKQRSVEIVNRGSRGA